MHAQTRTDGGFLESAAEPHVLDSFLRRSRIPATLPRLQLLRRVVQTFSKLPYENLTKIIHSAHQAAPTRARRTPETVLSEHTRWGTGGTCFSLTAALLQLIRALDWKAEPMLADRTYGSDTHCALLVWIDDRPHLLDPGFLIVRPVALDNGSERCLTTDFNQVVLLPAPDKRKIDLYTQQSGRRKYRLSYKPEPVGATEFLRAWDESFDWDMMHYPLLARVAGDQQLYLQGRFFQTRGLQQVYHRQVAQDQLPQLITAKFRISSCIVRRALRILRSRGALDG